MWLRRQIDQAGLCAAEAAHSRCDQQLEKHRSRLAVRRHPERQLPACHLQFHGQAVGGTYVAQCRPTLLAVIAACCVIKDR